MKKLIVILTFLSCSLLGQDNPMFDSVDYFLRNKIKTVHWYISEDFCSPGWDYLKLSFDKNTRTLNSDSAHYRDTSSAMAKTKISGSRGFLFRDSVYNRPGFAYSTTIKYQFDKKGRLIKKLDITEYYPDSKVPGLSASDKKYTTTTEYFYADASTKKIIKTTTKSLHYSEEINFIYEKSRLLKRVNVKTQKNDKNRSTDTFTYEYYDDGKLRKETRQLIDPRYKQPMCAGFIEYKYDTD